MKKASTSTASTASKASVSLSSIPISGGGTNATESKSATMTDSKRTIKDLHQHLHLNPTSNQNSLLFPPSTNLSSVSLQADLSQPSSSLKSGPTKSQQKSQQSHSSQQQQNLHHGYSARFQSQSQAQAQSQNQSNVTPIVIALLPSILSSLTGHSWMEYCLFALVLFYLYQVLKVPGDLLIQTRSKSSQLEASANPDESAKSSWKNREAQALAMYSLAPVVGGVGLYYTQMLLPNATLLQHFSASLFFMGAFVKPFLYLSGLVKDSFLVEIPPSPSKSMHVASTRDVDQCNQLISKLEKRLAAFEETFQDRVEERCKIVSEPLAKTLHFLKKERKRDAEVIFALEAQVEAQQSVLTKLQLPQQRTLQHPYQTPPIDSPASLIATPGTNLVNNVDTAHLIFEVKAIAILATERAEKALQIASSLTENVQSSLSNLSESLDEKIGNVEYRLDTSQEGLYEFYSEVQEQVRNLSKLIQVHHSDVQAYLSNLGSFVLSSSSNVSSPTMSSSMLQNQQSRHSSATFKAIKAIFDFTLFPILSSPVYFYSLVFGDDGESAAAAYSTGSRSSNRSLSPSSYQKEQPMPFFAPPPPPPALHIPFNSSSLALSAANLDHHVMRRNSVKEAEE